MKKLFLSIACASVLSVGAARAQVVVRIGPPPPRPVEVVPPPLHDHPDWAWHAGYHRWDGAHYVWVPGAYVQPPHPHAHWVDGRWVHRNGGYVWTEGRWR